MATQFTKNQTVRVKTVVPQGAVEALRMDEDGVVYCRLTWTDANGNVQTRWFAESELEAVQG
jgi:uncharacterized protein YodC (DUF2158 family)